MPFDALGLEATVLTACERKPAASDSTPATPYASSRQIPQVPAGSPLSRLVPKPQTGPRAGLPMTAVFGRSSLSDEWRLETASVVER